VADPLGNPTSGLTSKPSVHAPVLFADLRLDRRTDAPIGKEGAWFDDQPKFRKRVRSFSRPNSAWRCENLGKAMRCFSWRTASRLPARRFASARWSHLPRSRDTRAGYDRDDRLQVQVAGQKKMPRKTGANAHGGGHRQLLAFCKRRDEATTKAASRYGLITERASYAFEMTPYFAATLMSAEGRSDASSRRT